MKIHTIIILILITLLITACGKQKQQNSLNDYQTNDNSLQTASQTPFITSIPDKPQEKPKSEKKQIVTPKNTPIKQTKSNKPTVKSLTSDSPDIIITASDSFIIQNSSTTKNIIIGGIEDEYGINDGIKSKFNNPIGITTDGENLYIADTYNNTIRKINILTHHASTLGGHPHEFGYEDGFTSQTYFSYPRGIVILGHYLYITDTLNHTIRKIDITDNQTTTIAGTATINGFEDGKGENAKLNTPYSITTDGTYIYFSDLNNYNIRQLNPKTNEIITLAGKTGYPGSLDGASPSAQFDKIYGITYWNNNIYITEKNKIRKLDLKTKLISTLPINNKKIKIYGATGITTDGKYLYISDTMDHTIKRIEISTNEISILETNIKSPTGITINNTHLYVTDTFQHTIKRIYAE